VIYIQHTSFQLYHCLFPQRYLHELDHDGEPKTSNGVILNRSKAYDLCKVDERGEWFHISVALIRYLLSGESKVGFLNNSHPRNLIHQVYFLLAWLIHRKSKLHRFRWRLKEKESRPVEMMLQILQGLKIFQGGKGNEDV
jgi:hypothetical protein